MQREGLADRPRIDRLVGSVTHDGRVLAHALAVEGRQHQSPLAQMLGAVEQQHGAVSEHGSERSVCLARPQALRGAPEDLAHGIGVEHHHEAAVE